MGYVAGEDGRTEASSYDVAGIVKRQIIAMRSEAFEVGILTTGPERQGTMRLWDAARLMQSLGWLKAMNVKGLNINIRPTSNHLTLLDDVTTETIDIMRSSRFEPCCIVQTSPGNYQAWIDHGYDIPDEDATHAAQFLAKRFGSDYGAAGRRHFGRLAGFTNRKEKHKQANGRYPFVRLEFAQPGPYTAAPLFREELAAYKATMAPVRPQHPPIFWQPRRPLKSIEEFRSNSARYPKLHNADLAYAVYAVSHGIEHEQIRTAIASRDLTHKGNKRAQDAYITRTLNKAIRDATPS